MTVVTINVLDDQVKLLHDSLRSFMEQSNFDQMTSVELAEVTDSLNLLLECGSKAFNTLLIREARAIFRENTKVKLPESMFLYQSKFDTRTHVVFGNEANWETFNGRFGSSVVKVTKEPINPDQNFVFFHRRKTGVPVTEEFTGTIEQYILKVQDTGRVLIDAIILD